MEGTVKFFNDEKGFGFIADNDGKEYYVHSSALKEGVSITKDDKVSFKVVDGDRGPKAEEVEKASSESDEGSKIEEDKKDSSEDSKSDEENVEEDKAA